MHARLRWPPYPYRAGFTVTDDTDRADIARVRIVYDALAATGVRVTKTVWVAPPEEPCGIPALPHDIQCGVTLADPAYLAYCEQLSSQGFEIALHDPTAGNNRRELYMKAFTFMDRHFPRSHTHIGHARNADHLYWQERVVARGPLRWLLDRTVRGHQASGEDPASPYFWGDLCVERVRYMRLFRTRSLDTLAANPAMPYFEREKPFVRGWFSATKRSFAAATTEAALDALEAAWGMCMLYQYLCYWSDPATGSPFPAFQTGLTRLARRRLIWTEPASRQLDRLRLVQGIFIASRDRTLWVVNTNDERVTDLQIETGARPLRPVDGIAYAAGTLVVDQLAAGEQRAVELDHVVRVCGKQALGLASDGRVVHDFGHGRMEWDVSSGECAVTFAPGLELLSPRSRASDAELTRLFIGQASILAREVMLRGRHPDLQRFVRNLSRRPSDHAAWE